MPPISLDIFVMMCFITNLIPATNEPFTITIARSSLFPSDCWERSLHFLSNSTQIGNFRLISRQHDSVYRSLFRRKFDFFRTIFMSTIRQQQLRSWADIEGKIPFNPLESESFYRSTKALSHLLQFHVGSNGPIVCGMTNEGKPFISFYLENDNGIKEALLICSLDRNGSHLGASSIFDGDSVPYLLPRDSFGIRHIDWLLDGQAVRFSRDCHYSSATEWVWMSGGKEQYC